MAQVAVSGWRFHSWSRALKQVCGGGRDVVMMQRWRYGQAPAGTFPRGFSLLSAWAPAAARTRRCWRQLFRVLLRETPSVNFWLAAMPRVGGRGRIPGVNGRCGGMKCIVRACAADFPVGAAADADVGGAVVKVVVDAPAEGDPAIRMQWRMRSGKCAGAVGMSRVHATATSRRQRRHDLMRG